MITWPDAAVYHWDANQQNDLTPNQISMFSQSAASTQGHFWAQNPHSCEWKRRGQLDSCLRNSLTGNDKSTAQTESTNDMEWRVKCRVAVASSHPDHKRDPLRLGVTCKHPGKAEIKCKSACRSRVTEAVSQSPERWRGRIDGCTTGNDWAFKSSAVVSPSAHYPAD